MNIEIAHPGYLFLIPVVLAFFILSAFFLRRKQIKRLRRSIIVHSLTALFLILALCQLSLKWSSKDVTTIFVVDLSDSVKANKSDTQSFLKAAIQEMPANNTAGIITFGADVRLEQFVSDKKVFSSFQSLPLSSATNLESAVSMALSLIPEGSAGRIVLITDGNENEGNLELTASSVLALNVDFKVLKIENVQAAEAYIDSLTLPEKINIGDTFSINVTVISNTAMEATIYLYSGRTLKAEEKIKLQSGTNQFVFKDTQTDTGLKNYRAVLDAAEDTETVNNEYEAYTTVKTTPKVLVIEGSKGNAVEFEKILDAANINFSTVTTSGAPESLEQMLEYKSMICVDVYADDLKAGFLSYLESYVRDYGGGFVAIGGENSFALGNYKNTPLESVLPVYMDLQGEKEIPPLSMVMVIDHSGSMTDGTGTASKLELAKEAAVKALNNLRTIDKVGILSFDDGYTWNYQLALLSDQEEVEDKIFGIPAGGGTSIYPALAQAVDALEQDSAKLKHIILLTDGQDGYREYEDLLSRINDSGITLSTVSVGQDADMAIMEYLAEQGNGRYYHTDIETNIPRIFAKEVFLSVRSYLVNHSFFPAITSNSDIIAPAAATGLPAMEGYVATTAKESANILLMSDENDPVLAIWQFGLGKTAAFTSDVQNRWTAAYAGWDGYVTLWKNIIEATITELESGQESVTVKNQGTFSTISYVTQDYNSDTNVTAFATDPAGNVHEVALYPVSPGVYEGELLTDQTGVYSINVRQSADGELIHSLNSAAVIPYSSEYKFADKKEILDNYIKNVQGNYISEASEVFDQNIVKVMSHKSVTPSLLVLALVLFMTDTALRRLNIQIKWQQWWSTTNKVKKSMAKSVQKRYNKTSNKLDTTELLKHKKDRNKPG